MQDTATCISIARTLEILKRAPFPKDILALGAEGIKGIWHEAKLRGCGYAKADEIVRQAGKSVGLTDGADAGREAVRWFAEKISELTAQLAGIESTLHEKCKEIPHAGNLLEIKSIGENILSGIVSEMGT